MTIEEFPKLDPEEHQFIERMVGHALTNEEAQILLYTATLKAAFETWIKGKEPN